MFQTQNERDCLDERNKLAICYLQQPCGFGCQLHHITWCLILSFGLNRTMVLDDSNWSYSKNGWAELFLPVSSCSRQKINKTNASTVTGKVFDCSYILLQIVEASSDLLKV